MRKLAFFARASRSWSQEPSATVDDLDEITSILEDISYPEWQALLLLDAIIGDKPAPAKTLEAFLRAWPNFLYRAETELRISPDEADTYLLRCSRSGLYRVIVGYHVDDDIGPKAGALTPAFLSFEEDVKHRICATAALQNVSR